MIECYDALCLKEPYLELIMCGIKTLESRTKIMRKKGGEVLLTSSATINEAAFNDPNVGGLLDAEAKQRALTGVGKFAGLVRFGDCRPGVPGSQDDVDACISMLTEDGRTRFVYPITDPRRVQRLDVIRIRPDGTYKKGSSQSFFKVPKSLVGIL